MKKKVMTTKELLASIKIILTEVYAELRAVYPDSWRVASFTKQGPGRYHKQGTGAWVSRQQEYSSFRQIRGESGKLLGYRW